MREKIKRDSVFRKIAEALAIFLVHSACFSIFGYCGGRNE